MAHLQPAVRRPHEQCAAPQNQPRLRMHGTTMGVIMFKRHVLQASCEAWSVAKWGV